MNNFKLSLLTATCVVLLGAFPAPSQAGLLDDVFAKAEAARRAAVDARANSQETRNQMRAGLDQLNDQMRSTINEALDQATDVLNEEIAGRDAFVNSGACPGFRQDMRDLVGYTEGVSMGVIRVAGLQGTDMSLAKELQRLDGAKCELLYPLYRTIGARFEPTLDALLDMLSATISDLELVDQTLNYQSLRASATSSCDVANGLLCRTIEACGPIVSDEGASLALTRVAWGLNKNSMALTYVSKFLQMNQKIGVDKKAEVAIWGWAGTEVNMQIGQFFAKLFEANAMMLKTIADSINARLSVCANASAQDRILTAVEDFNAGGGVVDLSALLDGQSKLANQHTQMLDKQTRSLALLREIKKSLAQHKRQVNSQ